MKRPLATLLVFASLLTAASCGSSDKKAKDDPKTREKYEQKKESLGEDEKKNPSMFLAVDGHDKKNLIGQTVVRGNITNNAKVTTFKDIDIEISFFSKTETLLEKDKETIYEVLAPGENKSFKTKYFAPKGTDRVELKVTGAKAE